MAQAPSDAKIATTRRRHLLLRACLKTTSLRSVIGKWCFSGVLFDRRHVDVIIAISTPLHVIFRSARNLRGAPHNAVRVLHFHCTTGLLAADNARALAWTC